MTNKSHVFGELPNSACVIVRAMALSHVAGTGPPKYFGWSWTVCYVVFCADLASCTPDLEGEYNGTMIDHRPGGKASQGMEMVLLVAFADAERNTRNFGPRFRQRMKS
jgi:hypothetical protein